jgi:arylsulfatase A-like enzyme
MRLVSIAVLLLAPASATPPVAHWAFNGATVPARLAESLGRGAFNATEIAGGSSWVARPGFGEVLANGSNAPYLSATAPVPGTASFSISLWSNRTSSGGSTAGLLDALSASAGSGWQIFYQSNNTLRIRIDDTAGNTVNVDTPAAQVTLNTWQNIIVTVDRTAAVARIRVNGSEVTPAGGVPIAALAAPIVPDQALWIGTLNATNPAHGQIDDVALFDRLLTAEEITALSSGQPVLSLFPPDPPPASVAIHPPGGLLRPGQTVTLSAPGGAVPRYTLDGSDPTPSSSLYTGPLTLPGSGELRARTFSGSTGGPVASGHFALVPAAPPNIVLVLGERVGFGDLSCYGSVSTSTPRLDRLAAQGTRFTAMMAVGPGASSSPFALLTGRVARRGDLADSIAPQQAGWDRREWTLAESLRKAGYETAFIGAWKLGSAPGSLPRDQGFQLFHGLPWSPSQVPAPALFENDTVLDPAPPSAGLLDALATRAESYLSSRGTAPFLLVFQVPSVPAGGTSRLGPAGDRTEAFDHAAGRLLDRVDQLGLAEETLVLFLSESTADRSPLGPSIGSNAPFRDGDGTTWDGGLRLPAIARWTGVIPPGGDNLAPLWLPDLSPSLVALGQGWQPADRPYDGVARPEILLSARRGGDPGTRIFHHRRSGANHLIPAVRTGPWKLHLSVNSADPQNPAPGSLPLLFQTAIDPYERINLAAAQTTLVAEMQAALSAHAATFSAAVPQLPAPREPFLDTPQASFPPAGGVRLTFRRPADSLDDRYLLEFSGDLAGWASEATLPWIESVTRDDGDGTETVVLTLPKSHPRLTGPRAFVRLRSEFP